MAVSVVRGGTVRARRAVGAAVVGVLLALGAGCSAPPEPVGERVHTWDESDADARLLEEAAAAVGGLVTDPAGLTALADGIDAALAAGDEEDAMDVGGATEELRDTDLGAVVLVVVTYPRCTEYSQVFADTDSDPVTLRVEVTTDEPQVACDWSPRTLDVWAVDRDVVGDDVALATG